MPASIYTDLAMEARELYPDAEGVDTEEEKFDGINVTRISITSQEAAERLGKAVGRYITVDAPELSDRTPELFRRVQEVIGSELTALIGHSIDSRAPVLVVGLGNRAVTPDSIGPRAADAVFVTRHITEYLPEVAPFPLRPVSAIAPGVLGVTGVETVETVRGVAEHVKPRLIIAVDSLASRRAARISTTIQLSDAGISPGSGVGNARTGLTGDVLGIPVIAIGVPTVVFASTISRDTIGMIAEETGLHGDEERLKELAGKLTEERLDDMIVTPKDVDTIAGDMSRVLAEGINRALFGDAVEDIRELTM